MKLPITRTTLTRAALFTVTLVLAALAAEAATRWLYRDVTTSADSNGYFSRRWAAQGTATLNSAGFRGPEFTIEKPPGIYRIAAIGDSFTYGNGIGQHERYTDVLQARLPKHFEVLNFGYAGANTPQHLQRVKQLIPEIRPDFILLQWYVNDVEGSDSTGRPVFRLLMPVHSWHNWLTQHSAFYNVASVRWAEMQIQLGMTTSYPEYLRRRFADPHTREARADREALEEIVRFAKAQGVSIGIVLFPDTSGDLDEGYAFGFLHEHVLAVCAAHDIDCLDLRKDFAAIKDRRTLWANRLDHHPSARAHAIAAVRILETYASAWAKP